jgi:C1A family cysteine protease
MFLSETLSLQPASAGFCLVYTTTLKMERYIIRRSWDFSELYCVTTQKTVKKGKSIPVTGLGGP